VNDAVAVLLTTAGGALMQRIGLIAVLGILSLIIGATSSDERSWTWPFTWLGLILLIVAAVMAIRFFMAGRRHTTR
jgi:hypothetical protein